MITRSATRIAVVPGKSDARRLIGMIAGVAVGVALAALLWSGFTGLGDRSERSSWVQSQNYDPVVFEPGMSLASNQVAIAGSVGVYDSQMVQTLFVYGADPSVEVDIPGTRDGVAPGTAWVSPALAELIKTVPSEELGGRFGDVTGILPDRVLAGPDSLVAVVGVDEEAAVGFEIVSDLPGYRYSSANYELIALLGAVAVLIPVIMLIGVVMSFGSVDRAVRMRALHMLGATAADRAKFAAIEAGLVGGVGAIAGVVFAWFVALPVSLVSVNGSRFFPDDLRLEPLEAIVAIIAVPLVFAGIAAVRAMRVDSAPSSVRDRAEKPLGWWRVLPLMSGMVLVGVALFGVFSSDAALFGGLVLIAIGMILLGPILTHDVARFAHRRAKSAAGVIAYGRIQQHPRQIFRAVSGVVMAVFLVSLFMSGVTSVREGMVRSGEGFLPGDVLVFSGESYNHQAGMPAGEDGDEALADLASKLEAMPGVTGVARIYLDDFYNALATADELAKVGVTSEFEVALVNTSSPSYPVLIEEASSDSALDDLTGLFIATDSAETRERVRTLIAEDNPFVVAPMSFSERARLSSTPAHEYRSLAVLGILVAAGVSAAALAAATMSAVRDRRRTLGLLRLTGMPFSTVRGIMMREAAVPLIVATLGAIVIGYALGAAIVAVLSDGARVVTPPPLEFYVVIGITMALSILAVIAAFPAAHRATSGEATRFE